MLKFLLLRPRAFPGVPTGSISLHAQKRPSVSYTPLRLLRGLAEPRGMDGLALEVHVSGFKLFPAVNDATTDIGMRDKTDKCVRATISGKWHSRAPGFAPVSWW